LQLYYQAFWDLNSSRNFYSGGGAGPVPWHVIREYAREHDLSRDQALDLHFHMANLDHIMIEHLRKK
jgi:hypothetical protein